MVNCTYLDDCEMDLANDTGAPTISPRNLQLIKIIIEIIYIVYFLNVSTHQHKAVLQKKYKHILPIKCKQKKSQ